MAYLKKASFAAGELDPSLHDKTDIKSYYSGLATARNVVLSKTGRIINSAGTWLNALTKNNDVGTRIYAPEYPTDGTGLGVYRDYILEFGIGYIRAYYIYFDENYYKHFVPFDEELLTGYTLTDLPNLRFQTIKEPDDRYMVYVSCKDKPLKRIIVQSGTINTPIDVFNSYPIVQHKDPSGPDKLKLTMQGLTAAQMNSGTRLGHPVQYGITVVTEDGLESPILQFAKYFGSDLVEPTYMKLPVNNEVVGFYFTFFNVAASEFDYGKKIKYINIYRRPFSGGSPSTGDGSGWGLIGQSFNTYTGGVPIDLTTPASVTFGFTDFGQDADYTNPPPERFSDEAGIADGLSGGTYLGPNNIHSYNSRLLYMKNNYLFFSKTNFPLYILRDFPLSETTSTYFEIGNNGPQIYDVIEHNGLFIFTSEGIFYGGVEQPVSSLNPIIRKAGTWLIDPSVKPIVTPYGLLFVDRSTGSIRVMYFDNDTRSVNVEDISVYSNHLFYGKRVVSWAFKGGDNPYLFTVLNDGTGVSLTYSKDEKINAWTRHDTDGLYKEVISYRSSVTGEEYLMFTILRNGNLCIESESKRVLVTDTTVRTFAHSSVYTRNPAVTSHTQPFPPIATPLILTLGAVSGTWDTQVRATTGSDFTTSIGKTFAIYNPLLDDYYYLKLVDATPAVDVTFDIIDEALPVNLRNTPVELIECHTVVTGLSHLNGKAVSIYADNEVLASPNNEQLDLPTYTVSGGQITLPEPKAFSIVGLPYTSDIETLAIDSKDGSMSLDSKIVNNVVVRYSRTRGVYVGKFPEGDSVIDMEVADQWDTEDTVNRPLTEKITSKTYRPYSDWQLQGKVCLRQVDPLPMEVTSIILDVSGG